MLSRALSSRGSLHRFVLVVTGLVASAALLGACGCAPAPPPRRPPAPPPRPPAPPPPPRPPAPPAPPKAPLGRPALRQQAAEPHVWDNSDPGVLVDGGRTYLYGSTNNMALPVREITTFQGDFAASKWEWDTAPRNAMTTVPRWVNPADPEIWAPSAIRLGNEYWVYFAGHRKGATDLWDDQCVGRASATSPMGPFTPEADAVYCGYRRHGTVNPWGWGTLDPEVFRAPDGNLYLLAALSGTRDNIGSLRLNSAGKVIGGLNATPTTLVSQSYDFHDGIEDGRMGSEAFLENPTMTYDTKSRTYLLFYSAGRWDSSRYVTGFARCLSPQGPCTADQRGPFLGNGATRTGPGGFTVFTDAQGEVRAGYSTWQAGMEGERGIPNPYGLYSRHLTWARLQTTGTNPADQVVKLLPA